MIEYTKDEYSQLCDLRFHLDQKDKVFTDEQLLFLIRNKETLIYYISQTYIEVLE